MANSTLADLDVDSLLAELDGMIEGVLNETDEVDAALALRSICW